MDGFNDSFLTTEGGKLLATTELCPADWDPTGEWDISGRSETMGKLGRIRTWEDNFLKIRTCLVQPAEVGRSRKKS